LIKNLKEFVQKYGDDGKNEINSVCSNHKIVLAIDDTEKHNYCGSDIKDGNLRLLSHPDKFGSFPSDASNDIVGALKNAPAPAGSMNLATRNGIKTDYEAKVEPVRAAIAKIVGIPDLKLTPNFEYNYGVLDAMGSAAGSDWGAKLGASTLSYFQGVKTSLEKQKFDSDDMLQEGFQEAISEKEITLKIVDKLECGGSYNEVYIKDGVLIVQVSFMFDLTLFQLLTLCNRLSLTNGPHGLEKPPINWSICFEALNTQVSSGKDYVSED
jgi:hypothetical protein